MSNLATQRRTIITEQTVMLMSTPCETDDRKHSFRADISIDHVDPKNPACVIEHYKSESAELRLELPDSYHNFFAECLFKTKVVFGLLRHRPVSVQPFLEVQGKVEGSKRNLSQTLKITKANWAEIQRYLFGDHQCRFKLTARTSRKPWSLDCDPYTKLPLIPGGFPSQPRGSFRPSHYCQKSTLPKRSRALNATKNQKFGPSSTSLGLLPNKPGRRGRLNNSKTTGSDAPADHPVVRMDKDKNKGPGWSRRLFELCVGQTVRRWV